MSRATDLAPALRPWPASLERRDYGQLSDPEMAEKLREWEAWREGQLAELPADVRAHADLAGYVAWWDAGVEAIFAAATRWLREEAARRLLCRRWLGRARERVTTADLIAMFGDRVKAVGNGRWKTVCPWHEDRAPSLAVYEDGWCHCFACGAHEPVAALVTAWREGDAA